MSRLLSTATTQPSNRISQEEIAEAMIELFNGSVELKSCESVFKHARVTHRSLMRPLNWYLEPRTLAERNRVYLEEGVPLLARASRAALEKAGCQPGDIDHIITISSSGIAAPSLDARLIESLGLRLDITRIPVWGLGCAGGVMGLSMAMDFCRAYPDRKVLLAALETCSLTFQPDDPSRKNLIGTALFGDGAGAAVISGPMADSASPALLGHATQHFPDTEEIMGWEVVDTGFRLVLSRQLPDLVRREIKDLADRFLARHRLQLQDIRHFLLHPGGPRVLDAVLTALQVKPGMARTAEQQLARHGNLSSVSILAVIEEWQQSRAAAEPGPGLMIAFGPGFSCAMILLEV